MNMREAVQELERRREEIKKMGGADKVQKQHDRGKLTARERLARFFDDGVFFEVGIHGTQMGSETDKPPADAVKTASGLCVYGYQEQWSCKPAGPQTLIVNPALLGPVGVPTQ